MILANPNGLGDSSMSSGFFGNLNRKFCKMVVKKRKSSILARPSPKQNRFPAAEREEEHRDGSSSHSCLAPAPGVQLRSYRKKGPKGWSPRDHWERLLSPSKPQFPYTRSGVTHSRLEQWEVKTLPLPIMFSGMDAVLLEFVELLVGPRKDGRLCFAFPHLGKGSLGPFDLCPDV